MEETHTSCPPRSCRELLSGPEHFVCTCVSLLLFSFAGVRVLDVSDIAPSALRGFEELYGKSGGRRTKAAHVRGEEPRCASCPFFWISQSIQIVAAVPTL